MIPAGVHASPIREALEIGRSGHCRMRAVRSVRFRAPLDEYPTDKGASLVRPDGDVARRSTDWPTHPQSAFVSVLAHVSFTALSSSATI